MLLCINDGLSLIYFIYADKSILMQLMQLINNLFLLLMLKYEKKTFYDEKLMLDKILVDYWLALLVCLTFLIVKC
jgi:hypothetical protein